MCSACRDHECAQPMHAIDVDHLLAAKERKRFALSLAGRHGIQHLRLASVPRRELADACCLRMDGCRVVYERPIHKPRS
jgi:hypothetical protein